MSAVDQHALDVLFTSARSQNGWFPAPVDDDELRSAYDLAKFGPTSMNGQPMRLLFLRSDEAKKRLTPAISPGNINKVLTAPVVALIAYDLQFHDRLHETFPHEPGARTIFDGRTELTESTAFRNGTLQAAYFMLALRAVGLDVGPISGFDPVKVDAEFFADTSCRINFICCIGHGDSTLVFDRLPRLEFADVVLTI